MKKIMKFILIGGGVILGLFVLLLMIAAIAIPILLPPAKMKALVTDKLSTAVHHKVTVGDIHFNVLNGFDVKDLKIANRAGWTAPSMVNAKDISISYHLFPLLWGQVSLKEITLNEPEILVERRGLNSFNFSDMTGNAAAAEAPAPAPPTAAAPVKTKPKKKSKRHAAWPSFPAEREASNFLWGEAAWADTAAGSPKKSLNISADGLNIVHGKMVYLDETVSPAQRYNLKDFNFHIKNISVVGGKSAFALSTPFENSKLSYQLSMNGSYRYFMSTQTIKELDLKGSVNDLGFSLSGDAATMADNFTPNMDGEASLEMLKFSGLIPRALYSMPPGLALTGPAKVVFHLGGSQNQGLELSGTADGSDLAIQYQDVSVKAAKTTCKVNFKTVKKPNAFDVPSFSLLYQDWEVDGSFHYPNGAPWTCSVKSSDLPLQGLSDMIPCLKKASFGGHLSLNVHFAQSSGKATPFTYDGQISFKDLSITLPDEPYLQGLNSVIYLAGNSIKIPMAKFQSFDGTGMAGVTVNLGAVPSYAYAFRLDGVNAQKAVNASVDAFVTSNPAGEKNKVFGTMNLAYSGYGKGLTGPAMLASQVGAGNFSIDDAQIKDIPLGSAVQKYFKKSSAEMDFQKISGLLGMKNKIFTFPVTATGAAGVMRETGAINLATMTYSPEMKVQCDFRKDYLNSDEVLSGAPDAVRGLVKNTDWIADNNGNIPVDVKFTGPVQKNNFTYDWGRLTNNVKKKVGNAVQNAVKQKVQNLGNQLKGMFH